VGLRARFGFGGKEKNIILARRILHKILYGVDKRGIPIYVNVFSMQYF
jgi:hypothetical protein